MKKIFYSSPICHNTFLIDDYRISVIKDGVIRVEKDPKKKFNDEISQFAFVRDFPFNEFKVNKGENEMLFTFKDYIFVFNKNEQYILYQGKKLLINNNENLMGTYSTVDGMDGEVCILDKTGRTLSYGVCSKNGVAVIDDSDSYCLNKKYEFTKRNNDEVDYYIFFFPNNYLGAIKALFDICNYPPLLPKYAFGNWWSRYHPYTQDEYLHLMNNFNEEGYPFTVATLDMDWHYSSGFHEANLFKDLGLPKEEFIDKNTNKYYVSSWKDESTGSIGWTGYTFNKKLFPNYRVMLKDLKKMNLAITLNLHPADGIAFYEDCYEIMKKTLNLKIKKKETIPFDLAKEKFRTAYFEKILAKYQKEGVDFWWIDWQQGENSSLPGLTPMWLCNHYFFLENSRFNDRPLILSRYAGIGSHRYPLGFSGDSFQTYDSLKFLIKTTAIASNVGFSYWSHDIGGHMHGIKDGEQFLKFVQFGVFSPINRLHCSCEEIYDKSPLMYLKGYGDIMKKYLRLRHKMIPYIYSFSFVTNLKGLPLISPLYHYYFEEECYHHENEYIFGKDLLVRPFTEKANQDGFNCFKMYFPDEYYDLFYGYHYKKGNYELARENDSLPVFIKKGAFFILDSRNENNLIDNPSKVDVITSTGESEYDFYEDNNDNNVLITHFVNTNENNKQKINISFSGNQDVFNKNRVYRFKILNLHKNITINIRNLDLIYQYEQGEFLEFAVTNLSFDKKATISLNYQEDNLSEMKTNVLRRINYIDDINDVRYDLSLAINKCLNAEEMQIKIITSKLKDINKKALLEVLSYYL